MVQRHVLGYPRIGANRELKVALERYWNAKEDARALFDTARDIRARNWKDQSAAKLDVVTVGDFSLYDHVLDMSVRLGNIPARIRGTAGTAAAEAAGAVPGGDLDRYFLMARGRSRAETRVDACEMTKWFDTNYHYLVPEFSPETTFNPDILDLRVQISEAREAGHTPKPVILGPVSYLSLGKVHGSREGASRTGSPAAAFDKWSLLPALLKAYRTILQQLLAEDGVSWIQVDEPVLAMDLDEQQRAAFTQSYRELVGTTSDRLLLTTYFAPLRENLDLAAGLPVGGIHLDAVRGAEDIERLDEALGSRVLSLGVIDGRNIWRADLPALVNRLIPIARRRGDTLWIGSSCSLLHVPIDLDSEQHLDREIASWMAFARQKLVEIGTVATAIQDGRESVVEALEASRAALASRRESERTRNPAVRERMDSITESSLRRSSPYPVRAKKHAARFGLPQFPTTTIGSFPQTLEIRRTRSEWRRGTITLEQYKEFLRNEIDRVIDEQERVGLDVLVHGEPERNDMVEYFGEQLDGYAFTEQGWVQSYGSRCVKPPIIFGDISRPAAMTVEWISYAQSRTKKPVKGMLTGPITMMKWAFVRDDQDPHETARQIALALRDEVLDLEAAGIGIIQVDEAALREALPLRRAEWSDWLAAATANFRLATSAVSDSTQVHTHMCYSEFNSMIRSIAELDADVLTVEAARSNMELLDVFNDFEYPNEIGPGIYDIHSPNVPDVERIVAQLEAAAERIPAERLWVNPDCGLKTRAWEEVLPSLANMVESARRLRKRRATGKT